MAIVSFVLVGIGVLLILVGCWISYKDWEKKNADVIKNEPDAFDKSISALTKLMIAIQAYPLGQQLIVLGIVILIIAGLYGGIAKL